MKYISVYLLVLFVLGLAGCAGLERSFINPTPGYTNVVSVKDGRTTTLYVAGQVGSGDTMEEQFRTSFQAVLKQLAAGGAEFCHVVSITLYVVDYTEEYLPIISRVRKEVFGTGRMPAITMIGIDALAFDSMKVETAAVAVFDRRKGC